MNAKNRNLKKLFLSPTLKTCSNFYQTPEFRLLSNKLRKINDTHTDFSTFLKTHTNFNFYPNKNSMKSFHKTLMHKKLHSNPKFIEIERMCYTERNSKEKIKDKNNTRNIPKENFFLTNNNEICNSDRTILDYNYKTRKDFYKLIETEANNNNKIHPLNKSNLISSNLFLKFNGKKYLNSNYPDTLFPKVSDFIEDIKMVRTVKYINNLKIEKQKHEYAMAGLDNETTNLTVHSLVNSFKLLKNFKSSYITYNKYLINQIHREKNKLDSYIADENSVKEEVILLLKRFDDLMIEYEILTNFKNLFIAIKNKTKIMNINSSGKSFADEVKERLKKQITLARQNATIVNSISSQRRKIGIMRKSTVKLRNEKEKEKDKEKEKEYHSPISKQLSINNINKILKKEDRSHNRHVTVVTTFNVKKNEKIKKIERFNSLQPSSTGKINRIENFLQKNSSSIPSISMEHYDVQRKIKLIENNILESIEDYNYLESDIIYLKLIFSQEKGLMSDLMTHLIQDRINQLDYCKKYNILLNNRYKLLVNRNNDYSLFFLIYRKLNKLLGEAVTCKVQKFKLIIDEMKIIYDKNKLYYQNKVEKNEYKRAYIIKQLVKYIYKVLILVEKIELELIQTKNYYLKSNYYSEQIVKYANKMDIAKKLFNSKYKRNEELLRREKINQNTIKNLNRIIYKPKRKVAQSHQVKDPHKKRKKIIPHENENDMIFYL
jgi:hypothetical protein